MQFPGLFASIAGNGTAYITYNPDNTGYYTRFNNMAVDATNVYLAGVSGDYTTAWAYTTSNRFLFTKINHVSKSVSLNRIFTGDNRHTNTGFADVLVDSSSNYYLIGTGEWALSGSGGGNSRPWLGKFNSSDTLQWGNEYYAASRGQSGLYDLFLSGSTIYAPGNSNANARGVFYKINTDSGSANLAVQLNQGGGSYSNGRSGRVKSNGQYIWQTWIDSGPPVLNIFNSNDSISASYSYQGTIYPGDMNLDTSENIIVGGHNNGGAARIAKINANPGNGVAWSRGFTATGTTNAERVIVDLATNDIYASIPEVYDATNTYYHSYIVKYNSSGSIQWQRRFTSNFNGLKITDIELFGENMHIAGYIGGNVNGSKGFYIKIPYATAPVAQTIIFSNGDTITISNGSGSDSSQSVSIGGTSQSWGSDSAATTSFTPTQNSKSLTTVTKDVT